MTTNFRFSHLTDERLFWYFGRYQLTDDEVRSAAKYYALDVREKHLYKSFTENVTLRYYLVAWYRKHFGAYCDSMPAMIEYLDEIIQGEIDLETSYMPLQTPEATYHCDFHHDLDEEPCYGEVTKVRKQIEQMPGLGEYTYLCYGHIIKPRTGRYIKAENYYGKHELPKHS